MALATEATIDEATGYAMRLCRWVGISSLTVATVSMHAWRVPVNSVLWTALLVVGVSLVIGSRVIQSARRHSWLLAIAESLACVSAAWLVVLALEPIMIRHAVLPSVGRLIAGILAPVLQTGVGARGEVLLQNNEGALSVLPTSQVLCLPYWAAFLAAVVTSTVLNGTARGRVLWLISITAAMAIAVASFNIAQYADVMEVLVARGPQATFMFERPLGVLVALLLTSGILALIADGQAMYTRSLRGPPASALWPPMLAGGIVCIFLVDLPGKEKQGRVLIDDRLSQYWEPAARRLDEKWFGDFSTYSFSAATELMGRHFAVTVNQSQRYTDALLCDYDVVMLKTPRTWLDASEEAAIERFVTSGGGLLLVSDHTDLMGMSTRLNRLAGLYGMTFRPDSVGGLDDGSFSLYMPRMIETHPVNVDVSMVETMTGCSVRLGWGLRQHPIMVVPRQACQALDYSTPSFFGNLYSDASQPFGEIVLAASSSGGDGRVVAFADSTAFSSFALFTMGRDAFLFGVLSYLNVTAVGWWECLRPYLLAAMIGAFGWTLWRTATRSPLAFTMAIAACAWVSVPAGLVAARELSRSPGRVSVAEAAADRLAVVVQGCEAMYPPVLGDIRGIDLDQCFDTFLSAVPRTGVMPLICPRLSDAWGCRSILFMSPQVAPSPEDRVRLRKWTDAGGSLLVGVRNDHQHFDALDELLAPFNVTVSSGPDGLEVGGLGEAHWWDHELKIFGGSRGSGSVIVLVGLEELSRLRLGHAFEMPTRKRRIHYEGLYEFVTAFGRLSPSSRKVYGFL